MTDNQKKLEELLLKGIEEGIKDCATSTMPQWAGIAEMAQVLIRLWGF